MDFVVIDGRGPGNLAHPPNLASATKMTPKRQLDVRCAWSFLSPARVEPVMTRNQLRSSIRVEAWPALMMVLPLAIAACASSGVSNGAGGSPGWSGATGAGGIEGVGGITGGGGSGTAAGGGNGAIGGAPGTGGSGAGGTTATGGMGAGGSAAGGSTGS